MAVALDDPDTWFHDALMRGDYLDTTIGDVHLKVAYLGGLCPVQAEGWVNGIPFYFRSRHDHWSVSIGEDPIGTPWDHPGYYREEVFSPYGWEHDAGYMHQNVALDIIWRCAREFAARRKENA